MPFLDTRHKKKSFTLTTILLSVLILLLFYIGLTYMEPPIENGITVNLGTMEFGMGEVQPTEPVRPRQQEPEPEVTEQLPETPPQETIPEPAAEEEVISEEPVEEVAEQVTEEPVEEEMAAEEPPVVETQTEAEDTAPQSGVMGFLSGLIPAHIAELVPGGVMTVLAML